MQEQEVLELIEVVVRPLREKIQLLQKANQQLKMQIASVNNVHQNQHPRLRSSSRNGERQAKKDETREARSPSLEKRDKKPVWNYAKMGKQENASYKSPPPVDKNKYKQVQPKITTRYNSKQKINGKIPASPTSPTNGSTNINGHKKQEVKYLSFQKPNSQPKKIIGGQKLSENGSINDKKNSGPGSINESSLNKNINPENASQQISEHGESGLLPEEVPNQN